MFRLCFQATVRHVRRTFSLTSFATVGLLISISASGGPASQAPDIEVFLSGSSAQDESLESLMRMRSDLPGIPSVCETDTLDVYRGRIDGVRKRVFLCSTSGHMAGVPGGLVLAVHKSSGGSGEGVTPITDQLAVTYFDLEALGRADACAQSSPVLKSGDLSAYQNHRSCSARSVRRVPIAGISDIEPDLLADNPEHLVATSLAQIVWGLPVSKNFRNALQAIQGLVPAEVPHDDPARDTEASMPTLNSTQVASIFAGTLDSWNEVLDLEGRSVAVSSALPESPPARPDLSGTTPGAYRPDPDNGRPIYVCRRIESSGTQAAYEVHYLRQQCTTDAPRFVLPDDGSSVVDGGDVTELVRISTPAGRVFAGVGTSDVRACLDAHDDHNRWAIGMFSTENTGNNASREYRYVRVDGSSPTLTNAQQGRWTHVSQPSMQWHDAMAADVNESREGSVMRFISENIARPEVLRTLNTSFRHPWGRGGYLAVPRHASGFDTGSVTGKDPDQRPMAGTTRTLDGITRNCNIGLIGGATSAAFRESP